jgi:hypothetical protein
LPHFRVDCQTPDSLPDDPARTGNDNSSTANATQVALAKFIHVALSNLGSRNRIHGIRGYAQITKQFFKRVEIPWKSPIYAQEGRKTSALAELAATRIPL